MKKTKKQDSSTRKSKFLKLKNPWDSNFDCLIRLDKIIGLIPQEDLHIFHQPYQLGAPQQSATTVTVSSSNPTKRYTSVVLENGCSYPDSRSIVQLQAIIETEIGKILYESN